MTQVAEPSTPLGVCVLVDGVVVAWFAEFNEEAQLWCTENHFGRWLTWRAAAPVPIPLTEDEMREVSRKAAELADALGFQGGFDDLHGNGQVKVSVCGAQTESGTANATEIIEKTPNEGDRHV